MDESGGERIRSAVEKSVGSAMCAYVTAGYPDIPSFPDVLRSVARAADLVEIGVPFTDPMADGLTIQTANQQALAGGVSLRWLLDSLEGLVGELDTPILLMGYCNPFLAYGQERLVDRMSSIGVAGLIIPDLPFEESGPFRALLEPLDLALVQLVTPTTPDDRLEMLVRSSQGFVYAVSTTGVTGGSTALPQETLDYLAKVRQVAEVPVLAGFGIRRRSQVISLEPYVDGVVVGSALLEVIARGDDPGVFLEGLRPTQVPA